METYFIEAPWYALVIGSWLFFAGIYLAFASTTWLVTRRLMPALGHGSLFDKRPYPADQIQREILLSSQSILLFGVGMLFPWGLLQLGWAKLATTPRGLQVLLEILALVIWNEIHFYANHRLLHTRWLKRFHVPHHRSIVTSPWATYSFHPFEALLLGNVLILPMLVHDFSFYALLATPLFSLLFNSIGHSNYDFLPDADRDRWWLNGSRRHHLHHACYHGNFGFMFPFMDRLFGTALAPDAAEARLARAPRTKTAHVE